MRILNFGSCNIDYVYSMPHFVKPGETLSANARECFPGGKGLNQSLAIARSGANVYHAGAIGADGLFLKEILENACVVTDFLTVTNAPTGHAIIQVDENGENSIILLGGANTQIEKNDIDNVLANFSSGDTLVLQNEISNLSYIIDKACEKEMQIVLNPAPFHPDLNALDLNKLSVLILNEVEAEGFSGETVTEKVIAYFQERYPSLKVVLTLGAKGCVYFDNTLEIFYPSYSVTVKDTTSAGDTFTGYFVSGLTYGLSIEETLKRATAAAALAVSKMGAAVSIPNREEVDVALKTLKPNLPKASETEKKKAQVLSYMENNLKTADLDGVCSLLGYSKSYATVWIKKNFNTTFSDLLQKKRCEQAANLLKTTDLPVEHIIQQCGYENGSFFRRLFVSQFQKTPLQYRKFYQERSERP